MTRRVSTAAMEDIQSHAISGVYLFLITLSHSSWPSDIRAVNNREEIISNGVIYYPAGFEIKLAAVNGDKTPRVQLAIDNIDRGLVDEIRATPTPIQAQIQLVSHERPDIVEIYLPDMTLRDVTYTALLIQGSLVIDEILNMRFPKGKVTSTNYSGLY